MLTLVVNAPKAKTHEAKKPSFGSTVQSGIGDESGFFGCESVSLRESDSPLRVTFFGA
jgi:hypothetical protein